MQPRVVSETHDGTLTGEMRESIWFFGLLVCEVQVRKGMETLYGDERHHATVTVAM